MKPAFKIVRSKTNSNKYNAQKRVYDGIVFDSTKEYKRYLFLKSLEEEGKISDLRTHVTYELLPTQKETVTFEKKLKTKTKTITKEKVLFRSVSFTPDFVYYHNGMLIAEDVKGSKLMVSRDFPLRQKLMYYVHHIYVNVITKITDDIPTPKDTLQRPIES